MSKRVKRQERDVNVNVHRIFGEMIERNEQQPKRAKLSLTKKQGSKKPKHRA